MVVLIVEAVVIESIVDARISDPDALYQEARSLMLADLSRSGITDEKLIDKLFGSLPFSISHVS
jgi:hypothetical protein